MLKSSRLQVRKLAKDRLISLLGNQDVYLSALEAALEECDELTLPGAEVGEVEEEFETSWDRMVDATITWIKENL